ncbi:MAG: chemotaxis protein CheA [Moorellales bacterium]
MDEELLQVFVEEAEDLLSNLERITLRLEGDPQDREALNELFRTAHTLKGAASIAGVTEVAEVAHRLETTLEEVREGTRAFDGGLADVLLGGFDFVKEVVEALRRGEPTSPDRLEAVLKRLESALAAATVASAPAPPSSGQTPDLEALRRLNAGARQRILPALARGEAVWRVMLSSSCDPEVLPRDPLGLIREWLAAGELLQVQICTENLPALEALDPAALYLDFELYLKGAGGVCPTASRAGLSCPAIPLALEDFLLLHEAPARKEPGLAHDLRRLLAEEDGPEELAFRLDERADQLSDPSLKALLNNFSLLLYAAAGREAAAAITDLRGRLAELADALETGGDWDFDPALLLQDLQETVGQQEPAPAPADAWEASEALEGGRQTRSRSDLRVPSERIDHLFDLVGELVVAKNSLPYLVRRLEAVWGLQEAARELKERYLLLDRVVRELQDLVLALKLVPFRQLFSRFPRYVRDVSRRLGKEVRLIAEGEDTGCDKDVMETLYQPLLHLVRNSLDHGLEPPEERAAAGKERTGRVWLRAGQVADRLFVEVADDGRGIDPDRVRARALQRGLLSPAQAQALSDREVVQLVFRPHFSTAEKVSELSGRGVGMDAVRKVAEELGGQVEIENSPGRGLAVRLYLPLTLATTRILLFEVLGRRFGLAAEAVREAVRVDPAEVRTLKGREVIVVRGEVIPLVRLSRLLELGEEEGEHLRVILLKSAAGLVVTRLLGEEDVVLKPLPPELAGTGLYQAAAVLGDGAVVLVMDALGLIREGSRSGTTGSDRQGRQGTRV